MQGCAEAKACDSQNGAKNSETAYLQALKWVCPRHFVGLSEALWGHKKGRPEARFQGGVALSKSHRCRVAQTA